MARAIEPTSWPDKLRAAIRQDPKKTGTLAVLLAVLVILFGRMLMTGNTVPVSASAASVGAPAAAQTGTGSRAGTMTVVAATPNPFRSVDAKEDQRLRVWMSEPIRPVSRNLFSVKLEYYPRDGSRPGQGVKTARDGEFWGRLEKSLLIQADQRDKRDNLLANFKEEAGKLRLDSMIMGPQPKAMINGRLVAEGEVVALFRVLKIEPRRILVEREGIRLEIQMK